MPGIWESKLAEFDERPDSLENMNRAERAFSLDVALPRNVPSDYPVSVQTLRAVNGRENLLYIPKDYLSELPTPLMVLFHGAKGEPGEWVELFRHIADSKSIILLMPSSSGSTWDLMPEEKSQDVLGLEILLKDAFDRYAIDASHVAVGGFSDGASYALAIGLMNPEIFTDVIALSPGSLTVPLKQSGPKVFIAHGTHDEVLPVSASRQIRSRLMSASYAVDYTEFESGHRVPLAIAHSAVESFLR